MKRQGYPYLGKRYLLNINTYELHDLDNEKIGCRIDEIKKDHIEMYDSLLQVQIKLAILNKKLNGCYYCMKSLDIG